MEEITRDTVERAITAPDAMLDALSQVLKSVATEAAGGLAAVLGMLGVDPTTMPGQYFAQAMLVAADQVFQPVTRDEWIEAYDAYHQVKTVLEQNPDLREALVEKKAALQSESAGAPDALLDGEF